MNIFVVDSDPVVAAHNLCDKHVVKMIVETAQMLSTAHRVLDGVECQRLSKNNRKLKYWRLNDIFMEQKLCLPTMVNHPCTKWAMTCNENYHWLAIHGVGLCDAYTTRYNKIHSMHGLITVYLTNPPKSINRDMWMTPFAQAMPEKYKNEDAVKAYRDYYIYEKSRFAKWNRGESAPDWYLDGVSNIINTSNEELNAIL